MKILQRLKNRPDSEHLQALARIVIACIGLVYTLVFYDITQEPSISILYCAWFLLAYLILASAILVLIFIFPQVSPVRRLFGMVSDLTGSSVVLHLLGQAGPVFLFVPLWVVVGNGLRYGTRYLYAAMVVGIFGFLIMVANTTYWSNDIYLAFGYIASMIILPIFFSSLLKKLNATNAELAKLAARLRTMATHDALTGLPNRQLFLEELTHELSSAQRHVQKAALLFIDLDGFKDVNDTLGHQAGDVMLKTISTRLLSHVRKIDLVARLGGDEFVILLTDLDRDTAARVTHKLIHDIANPIEIDGHSLAVTASIGIAIFDPDHGATADDLMDKADAAMYRSKQAGKNRMMVDGDVEPVLADVAAHSGTVTNKQVEVSKVLTLRPFRSRIRHIIDKHTEHD